MLEDYEINGGNDDDDPLLEHGVIRFDLVYRGPLGTGGNSEQKQRLRSYFHGQLVKVLGTTTSGLEEFPFRGEGVFDSGHRVLVFKTNGQPPAQRKISAPSPEHWEYYQILNGQKYAPFISKKNRLHCNLDVSILDPVGATADFDNKVKVLMDGLRIPQVVQEAACRVDADECYCLLEDDNSDLKLVRSQKHGKLLLDPTDPKERNWSLVTIGVEIARLNAV